MEKKGKVKENSDRYLTARSIQKIGEIFGESLFQTSEVFFFQLRMCWAQKL